MSSEQLSATTNNRSQEANCALMSKIVGTRFRPSLCAGTSTAMRGRESSQGDDDRIRRVHAIPAVTSMSRTSVGMSSIVATVASSTESTVTGYSLTNRMKFTREIILASCESR